MLATSIVAFFSALSAASAGAHNSLSGLLSMLSACRYVHQHQAMIIISIIVTDSSLESVLEQITHVVQWLPQSSRRNLG